MKKFGKVLILCLIATLTMGIFVGCGDSKKEKTQEEKDLELDNTKYKTEARLETQRMDGSDELENQYVIYIKSNSHKYNLENDEQDTNSFLFTKKDENIGVGYFIIGKKSIDEYNLNDLGKKQEENKDNNSTTWLIESDNKDEANDLIIYTQKLNNEVLMVIESDAESWEKIKESYEVLVK